MNVTKKVGKNGGGDAVSQDASTADKDASTKGSSVEKWALICIAICCFLVIFVFGAD